jgi:hypothetical protein
VYYVDLIPRTGVSLAQALASAKALHEERRAAGIDQAALEEAARQGFACGAFEESAEEGMAVVEEFFQAESEQHAVVPSPSGLSGKLERKAARLASKETERAP